MLKVLLNSIREYKRKLYITPVLVTGEVIMEILIPLILAGLIDYGIDQKNMNVVLKFGMVLLLLTFIELICGSLAGKTAAEASAGYAANLRKDAYDCVQNFSFSNIDKFSTASIITRLTTDVTNVQNAYQMIIRLAVRGPLMMVAALFVAFRINAQISMVFFLCIPVLGIVLILIMKKAHPMFKRVFQTYDSLNQVVQENLRGIRVVKSYNREDYETKKFTGISQKIFLDFSKAEKLLAFNMPVMQLCMYGCMLLISWFGARAIVASGNQPDIGLTTGQLMSLISYAMQILMSLMMLSMVFVMITMARSSAERIVELLMEESDIKNNDNPEQIVANGDITFEQVSFVYASKAQKKVLDRINLTINAGSTVGILGGTGSSKSSLVQLIPRLYDATEGRVLVGGVDVRDYDLNVLRDSVAMVLQKNVLFSGTVIENLRWGNEQATETEIIQACKLAQADEFICAMPDQYHTCLDQGGSNVSGGQKQRLCIARALLKNPKILILDDSTSAVDTRTDALIQSALASSIPNTTKIIIAQRVSSVWHCDQIIVMDDGKIADTGTHEELLGRCSIYQEINSSQHKGDEVYESE